VEQQLEMKEYATGAFMDIEGAFDSISIDTIKQAMNRHVPEAAVDWTENMLVGRRIMVYHGEKMVEGTPDRGCPQGGVLSPLLWCLVVNNLLEDLQREGFHVYGYADNITIVAGGRFLTALRDLTEYALKIT
jgi:retron-type reverse transcriptase